MVDLFILHKVLNSSVNFIFSNVTGIEFPKNTYVKELVLNPDRYGY